MRAIPKFIWCKSSVWEVNCLTDWMNSQIITTPKQNVLAWSKTCSTLFDTFTQKELFTGK